MITNYLIAGAIRPLLVDQQKRRKRDRKVAFFVVFRSGERGVFENREFAKAFVSTGFRNSCSPGDIRRAKRKWYPREESNLRPTV